MACVLRERLERESLQAWTTHTDSLTSNNCWTWAHIGNRGYNIDIDIGHNTDVEIYFCKDIDIDYIDIDTE